MSFGLLVITALVVAITTAAAMRWTRQYAAVAVASSGAILFAHGWWYFGYTSDDAYISYRYARNLADGLGLVWNPGEHVEGYSNFLWVMMLAGLHRAGADIVLSGRWLGFALALVAAAGTYLLATQLLDGVAGRVAGVVAALLLSASGAWAIWVFAGLEAPLFATLALAAVLLHFQERRRGWLPASGAVWALAAMTRPDGILLFALSGPFKAAEGALRARATEQHRARAWAVEAGRVALWLAAFAAVFVPYFLWRYQTYGWYFPNTYYAKVGGGIDQYERGLNYLVAFSQEYGGWLLLLVPIAIALTPMRRWAALYALTLVLGWMAYVTYIGGDSLLQYRFFAPLLPMFYVLIAASGAALVQSVRFEREPPLVARQAALAVAVLALAAFTMRASNDPGAVDAWHGERQGVEDRVTIGRWLRDNVPDSTLIAVVPAGAIPYESRLRTIDMLGITDEHIAHRNIDLGLFPAGHEKYDPEYVLDREPDIILLTDDLSERPWARADYATVQTSLIPARSEMYKQKRLWDEYEPRAVEVQEGKWFNLLVRKDALAVLAETEPTPL